MMVVEILATIFEPSRHRVMLRRLLGSMAEILRGDESPGGKSVGIFCIL